MTQVTVLTAKTHLGSSAPKRELWEVALARRPSFVGIQGASADHGPYYLGSSSARPSRAKIKSDLADFLPACVERGIPFAVGGCPTAGTAANVDQVLELVREIASERNLSFKLAAIYSDIPKRYLHEQLAGGRIEHLEFPDQPLTAEAIDASDHLVAYMGWEPFVAALEAGAQVIVSGRCCDDALFAAPSIRAGIDPGIAWHVGKIIECGGLVAKPVDNTIPILAEVRDDHFVVEPIGDHAACTVDSVAAHNLYERVSGFRQRGPAGTLDMTAVTYEQVTPRAVKVRGARLDPRPRNLLIEGAGLAGYRAVSIAGVRDPEVIKRLRDMQAETKRRITADVGRDDFTLTFYNYGIDGTMGEHEPLRNREPTAYEVGVVIDVVAASQEVATDVCQRVYATGHMVMYPGRVTGEGNFASPFAPDVFEVGPVYRYTVNHLVPIAGGESLFPIKLFDVRGDRWEAARG